MNNESGHGELALAFAFLAGALLGAGIAILLAPKSGAETRAQVADWAKRAQEKVREAAERMRSDEPEPGA